MSALKWIYRRIGQMTCFALASVMFIYANASTVNEWAAIFFGLGFLATGLCLRWMMLAVSTPQE